MNNETSSKNDNTNMLDTMISELIKTRGKTEKDLNIAKNALKLIELDWLQLKEMALKTANNAPVIENVERKPERKISPDDVHGINSEQINSFSLETFSKTDVNKFVASEDESDY